MRSAISKAAAKREAEQRAAYGYGRECRRAYRPLSPYERRPDLHREWLRGWSDEQVRLGGPPCAEEVADG